MARRTRTGFWLLVIIPVFLASLVAGPVAPVSAADPTARPFLGEDDGASVGTLRRTQTAAGTLAVAPGLGRIDGIPGPDVPDQCPLRVRRPGLRRREERAHQGLRQPDATRPPTRLRRPPHQGRRLLGPRPARAWRSPRTSRPTRMSTSCTPTTPPIGGTAPVWNDACPHPARADDRRLRRQRPAVAPPGDRQRQHRPRAGAHQRLVPAVPEPLDRHLAFGPDGALYVSGGDGASFTIADYGQVGGSRGQPDPGEPLQRPDQRGRRAAEPGHADDAQRRRRRRRRATARRSSPMRRSAYWRLGETSGIDRSTTRSGTLTGWYGGTIDAGASPAPRGRHRRGRLARRHSGYVSVPDCAALDLGERAVQRGVLGQAQEHDRQPCDHRPRAGFVPDLLRRRPTASSPWAATAAARSPRSRPPRTDTTSCHHCRDDQERRHGEDLSSTASTSRRPAPTRPLTNSTTNLSARTLERRDRVRERRRSTTSSSTARR